MGLLGGLLEWIGARKTAAPARRVVAPTSTTAPVVHREPSAPPAEPVATARNVTPAAPKSAEELAKEKEQKELHHSFQAGILDARFKDLDVDHRFLEDFRKMVESGLGEFAVPPAAAFDVMRIVDDPGYPVKKVAAAISCDPSLAGSVVSLANSPLHRGDVPVDTLPTAIVRLGQRHLRLLLLEIALSTTRVKAKPYEGFSTRTWKHSLFAAQLAHGLATVCGQDADHAYMAGLFHDIGTFAVLTAARKLATRQSRNVTAQTLLKLIDAHAHVLDEKVVKSWRLPDAVGLAVVHRRAPHEAKEAAALAAVTALANDLGRPLGAWVPAQPIDWKNHPAVALLKIDPAKLPDEKALLGLALKIEKVGSIS